MTQQYRSQYNIREATLDDIEVIRHMHAQSWLDTYPNEDKGVSKEWVKHETDKWLTPEGFERSRQHFSEVFNSSNHFYRIAMDGDTVIGFIHGVREDDRTYLGALYVARNYHGKGIAQRLMDEVNMWFGDDNVDLDVVTYNKRAQAFYRKYGFEITDKKNKPYEGRIPNITMVRKGDKR